MANKTYTTVAKIENYLLTEIDPSFESQVTAWIEGVSRMMERMTGREFSADATASARFFDGRGNDTLLIDDALEVSAVEVGDFYGENFAAITDYVKKGTPIRKLVRKGVFDEGYENVKVTAKWGYPATTPRTLSSAAPSSSLASSTTRTKASRQSNPRSWASIRSSITTRKD